MTTKKKTKKKTLELYLVETPCYVDLEPQEHEFDGRRGILVIRGRKLAREVSRFNAEPCVRLVGSQQDQRTRLDGFFSASKEEGREGVWIYGVEADSVTWLPFSNGNFWRIMFASKSEIKKLIKVKCD